MTYQQEISITSKGHGDMHDLTGEVAAAVRSSAIQSGIVHLFHVGSTGAIGTIEFEPGLRRDLPAILDQLIPPSPPTVMSRHGTMATAIRIFRLLFSGHRLPCPLPKANSHLAPGSRFFISNATFGAVNGS